MLTTYTTAFVPIYKSGFKSFDRLSIFARFCCKGFANELSRDRMNHILALLEYFFHEATDGFFFPIWPKSALSW